MSEKTYPKIVIYGTSWCPDCRRTESFLKAHGVPFEYHDAELEGLEDEVIRLNEEAGYGPRRRVPTLLIEGKTFSVPSDAELGEVLELQ